MCSMTLETHFQETMDTLARSPRTQPVWPIAPPSLNTFLGYQKHARHRGNTRSLFPHPNPQHQCAKQRCHQGRTTPFPSRAGRETEFLPLTQRRGADCLALLHLPSDVSQSGAKMGSKVTFASSLAFGLNRIPNFSRDVYAVKTLQFLDAGWGGHVDLCQVFPDHVDAYKHLTLFFQKRANACANF